MPRRHHVLQLGAFTALTLVLAVFGVSHAQITLDGSLGPAGALTGPNFVIPASVGQTRGSNLFHSFGLFNVLTGESANFTGPSSINNIIGRVTGGQKSTIDGKISSEIAGANLFLINPAGMVFGPNASLDVKGSFHVSTADYLKFADGAKFHADLAKQSTLSTSPVSAFGFLSQNPAPITIDGSTLHLPLPQTFSIVGGDINIQDAELLTFNGRINIVSVASPGEVNPNQVDLRLDNFDRLGTINILFTTMFLDRSPTPLNRPSTIIEGGANLGIHGGTVIVDNSTVFAGNGRINISGGDVTLTWTDMFTEGINIRGGNITIDVTNLDTETRAIPDGGAITIIGDQVVISDFSNISSSTAAFFSDSGNGGPIIIAGRNVSIFDSTVTSDSSTTGERSNVRAGNAGQISITATDKFVLGMSDELGLTLISSSVFGGDANGGAITITAPRVDLKSSFIETISRGRGKSGDIVIDGKKVQLTGQVSVSAQSFGTGDAGNIRIVAKDSLRSTNSSITTESRRSDGGNIDVKVGSLVELVNSQITANVGEGEGKGGNISIDPPVVVLNNTEINANAFGGPGGNVNITADVFLKSADSRITASSENNVPGTVNIQAPITDLTGSLAPLPEAVLQASSLMNQSCAARYSGGRISSLVAGSREGLPLEPGGFMPSPLSRIDGEVPSSTSQLRVKPDGLSQASPFLASVNPMLSSSPGCTK
jgi:filamentous hemagglutinin family protein